MGEGIILQFAMSRALCTTLLLLVSSSLLARQADATCPLSKSGTVLFECDLYCSEQENACILYSPTEDSPCQRGFMNKNSRCAPVEEDERCIALCFIEYEKQSTFGMYVEFYGMSDQFRKLDWDEDDLVHESTTRSLFLAGDEASSDDSSVGSNEDDNDNTIGRGPGLSRDIPVQQNHTIVDNYLDVATETNEFVHRISPFKLKSSVDIVYVCCCRCS